VSGRRGRVFAVGSRVLGRSYAVQVRLSAICLPAPLAHPYSRTQIIGLLELLPRLYQETQYGEVALGAAVKGALAGLVSLRHSASRLSLTLMFSVWLWRTTLHLPLVATKLGSWSFEVAGRSPPVWHGQGKIALLSRNTVLAEYSRGTSRGRRGGKYVLIPRAVHRCCFRR
jgi:hypothetical protein